jgi:hypothetical protein
VRALIFDTINGAGADDDEYYSACGEMMELGFGFLMYLKPRKSYTTRQGRRILADERAQADDEVVVIWGERVPFVIRRTGTNSQLIGWAFHKPIMRGEAFYSSPASEDDVYLTLV